MANLAENLTLTKTDQGKWGRNILLFFAPVFIIYLVAVIGLIQIHNGAVQPTDFIPNPFTLGAGTLYVLNSLLDYLRKLRG